MTIVGTNGSTALGGSITISSGVGMAISLGRVAVSNSNTGTAGILGELSLKTGTARVGDSDALGILGVSRLHPAWVVALQSQWALAPTSEGLSV